MLISTTIAAAALGLICAGLIAWRAGGRPPADRALLALLPLFGLLFAVKVAQGVHDAQFQAWNDVRLAPTFGLTRGYWLYSKPRSGPIQSTMYTPFSALSYLPATLATEPRVAMKLGAGLALLYYFAPVLVLIRGLAGRSRLLAWYGFFGFATLTFAVPDAISGLSYSATHVHSDAPALGLAMAACAAMVLGGRGGTPGDRPALAAAVLAWLALWSKQVMLPTLAVLHLWAWLAHGPRFFARFLAMSCAVGLFTGAAFLGTFGVEGMVHNALGVPGKFPWLPATAPNFPGQASWVGGFPANLLGCLFALLNKSAFFLLVIAAHVLDRLAREAPTRPRAWFAANGWALPVLAGVAAIPISAAGTVKVGGYTNSESPTLYFLAAGFVAMIVQGHARSPGRATARAGLIALAGLVVGMTWEAQSRPYDLNVVLLCVVAYSALLHAVDRASPPDDGPAGFARSLLVALTAAAACATTQEAAGTSIRLDTAPAFDRQHNFSRLAFDYLRAHPRRAYFPMNPLAHMLAEGKLYHFLGSVHEWDFARIPVDPGHLRAHLPPDFEVVCYPNAPTMYNDLLNRFLPEYSEPVAIPGLPNFKCYARKATPAGPVGHPQGGSR